MTCHTACFYRYGIPRLILGRHLGTLLAATPMGHNFVDGRKTDENINDHGQRIAEISHNVPAESGQKPVQTADDEQDKRNFMKHLFVMTKNSTFKVCTNYNLLRFQRALIWLLSK